VSADEKSIQARTNDHREAKKLQEMNKCCADSTSPQPDTKYQIFEKLVNAP
jgi:hypothetical protein